MSGFRDHFSGHAERYAAARPEYPPALFAWLAGRVPARDVAWDCATGNGQAALALAGHFDLVHATDASREQIANARPHARVRYAVAEAGESGLSGQSVDLVTVAQAAHWFDLPGFYREVNRVLRPGGVVALWGYGLTRVDPAIDRVMDHFDAGIVGAHWPPERRYVDNRYADFAFPFRRLEPPAFMMQQQWTLNEFLAYLETWSAVQRYRATRGHDPLVWLKQELDAAWGRSEQRRTVRWPLFMLAGVRD